MSDPTIPIPDPFSKLASLMASRREPRPHLTIFGDCAFDMSKVTAVRPAPGAPALMQIWMGDVNYVLEGPAAEALREWIKNYRKECVCSE